MVATEHPTNALVVEHATLVGQLVSVTLGRVPAHVSRADLTSAGNLALVKAARAYDPTSGVPFARYATLRIRGALLDELRGMDWISRTARQRARTVTEVADRLAGRLGRVASREEVAAELGVDVGAVDVARGAADVRVLSFEGVDGHLAETLPHEGQGPEEAVLVDERIAYLRAAVEVLPVRLRRVVQALFLEDVAVADLADELGVTQSRISQLRTEALGLLKDGLNASLEPGLVPLSERPEGVAQRRRQEYYAAVAQRAASNRAGAATAA